MKLKCICCETILEERIDGITFCPKCEKIRIGGIKVDDFNWKRIQNE